MKDKLLIQNFKEVMKKNLSIETFNILINNIEKVKIKHRRNNDKDITITTGNIDHKGIITLYEQDDITLYHELFHAASTYYDEKQDNEFSGFNHHLRNPQKFIGLGFNEGYTQLLTERYFNNSQSCDSYVNEVHYVKLIENLMGKEKMLNLYFKSDLINLILELCKNNSEEQVFEFLTNMDLFIISNKIRKDKVKQMQKGLPSIEDLQFMEDMDKKIYDTYISLNQFIIESYMNKSYNETSFNIKKEDLIQLMSKPLSFNFKEYPVDIEAQINEYYDGSRKI